MRSNIEQLICNIKCDLQISKTCHSIRENIEQNLRQYCSKEMTDYLVPHHDVYPITAEDPEQIVFIKKLLNSLKHVEKVFSDIENLDMRTQRYTLGIGLDLFKILYLATDQLTDTIKILNSMPYHLQRTIGPSVFELLKILPSSINGQIPKSFTDMNISNLGSKLAEQINQLPSRKKEKPTFIAQLIHDIPDYLRQATSALSQQAVEQKSSSIKLDEIQKKITEFTKDDSFLNYGSLMQMLVHKSLEILEPAQQLTQISAEKFKKNLLMIKLEIIPKLLSELEKIENVLGLKTGILSKPCLELLRTHYAQLVEHAEKLAKLSERLETTQAVMKFDVEKLAKISAKEIDEFADSLAKKLHPGHYPTDEIEAIFTDKLLEDNDFIRNYQNLQMERLSEHMIEARLLERQIRAAEEFFDRLEKYYPSYYGWKISNLSKADKKKLTEQFNLFHQHFAEKFPEVSQLIEENLTSAGSWTPSLVTDQFKEIIFTKQQTLETLKQAKSTQLLQIQSIQQQMENTIYNARVSQVYVTKFDEVTRYHETDLQTVVTQNNSDYTKITEALQKEIIELEKAQSAIKSFIRIMGDTSSLQPNIKQNLLYELQKFQAFLESPEEIIEIVQGSQYFERIKVRIGMTQESITRHLENKNKDLETALNIKYAKISEQDLRPIVIQNAPKTLLRHFSDLETSAKLEQLIAKLPITLEKLLSESIFRQLNFDNPSATKLYNLDSNAQIYQNLIQLLVELKQAVKQLEECQKLEKFTDISKKTQLVYKLSQSITSIITVNSKLSKILAAPALQAITKEFNHILEPFKEFQSASSTEKPEQTFEQMLVTFNQQQTLFQSFLTNQPLQLSLASPSQTESLEAESDIDSDSDSDSALEENQNLIILQQILKKIGETEYQITGGALVTDQIKRLTEFLSHYNFSLIETQPLKEILITLEKLEQQLNKSTVEGKHYIHLHLAEIRSKLGFILVNGADEIEFQLGLKPGVISEPLSDYVDDFFKRFIKRVKQENAEIKIIQAISDISHLSNKSKKETSRFEKADEDKTSQIMLQNIFGEDFSKANRIYQIFMELQDLESMSDEIDYDKSTRMYELKLEASQLGLKFHNEFNTRELIDQMPEHGHLPHLQKLIMQGDFSTPEKQLEFLKIYHSLQPYLEKIDSSYNQFYFFRTLVQPQDFLKAAKAIENLKIPLDDLIQAQKKGEAAKKQLAFERMDYCYTKMAKHEKETQALLADYKIIVFNEYLNTDIFQIVRKTFGDTMGLPFFQEFIRPALLEQRDSLLTDIDLNDGLRSEISKKINERYELLFDKQLTQFKEHLFNEIVKKFTAKMEVFAQPLVEKFMLGKKHEILEKVKSLENLDQDIEQEIERELKTEDFLQRIKSLADVEKMLTKEKSLKSHQPRLQKIQQLEGLKAQIMFAMPSFIELDALIEVCDVLGEEVDNFSSILNSEQATGDKLEVILNSIAKVEAIESPQQLSHSDLINKFKKHQLSQFLNKLSAECHESLGDFTQLYIKQVREILTINLEQAPLSTFKEHFKPPEELSALKQTLQKLNNFHKTFKGNPLGQEVFNTIIAKINTSDELSKATDTLKQNQHSYRSLLIASKMLNQIETHILTLPQTPLNQKKLSIIKEFKDSLTNQNKIPGQRLEELKLGLIENKDTLLQEADNSLINWLTNIWNCLMGHKPSFVDSKISELEQTISSTKPKMGG